MRAELKAITEAHSILSQAKIDITLLDCSDSDLLDSLCISLEKLQKKCDRVLTIYGMGKPA